MISPYLYYIIIIFELLAAMSLAVYSVSVLYSFVKGAPYVATKKEVFSEILAEADLQPGQLFIELGCGDGRVVREAVKKYGVQGIGVDINPTLTFLARNRAHKQRIKNITFLTQDITQTDLKLADVVYLFLLPKFIDQLKFKFQTELRHPTLVISHGFKLPYFEEFLVKELPGKFRTYFYRVER